MAAAGIMTVPHRETSYDVVRRMASGFQSVLGFVSFEPWSNAYTLRNAEGRIVRAGFGAVEAALEFAVIESHWP